jgi:hypothetical protein
MAMNFREVAYGENFHKIIFEGGDLWGAEWFILVLVDHPLEQTKFPIFIIASMCFNPCCNGSSS